MNELDKKFKLDLKIFVEIVEYYNDYKTHIKVDYQLIGFIPNKDQILNEIETLIKKPPLSKFGIKSIFKLLKNKNLNKRKYYRYTKTNSYSYSDLPENSPKIKVVSPICVNLNEDDYS